MLRSSLFLGLYCTLAWRGVCTGFRASGRTSGAVIAGSCWVAGLAVLVEKRSRRMELALYCLARVRGPAAASLPLLGNGMVSLAREQRQVSATPTRAGTCPCCAQAAAAPRPVSSVAPVLPIPLQPSHQPVQAAESFALSVAVWGWVRPGALPRRLDVLLFSLASGFILHCYS